jgi:lipid II:glycine glycyltransferase (peptidoglycan interpeptide bridge formation enzyme)
VSRGAVVTSIDRDAPAGWDERAVRGPGGHVMQGTAWAAHRRAQGADPRFVTFDDGGVALAVLRRQPLVPGMTVSVRRGPPHAGDPPVAVAARAVALAKALRSEGARDLFLDPELDASEDYERAMDAAGFGVAAEVQPSIHVMRLTLPPGATTDAIWSGISKSTRQRIRAAERAGTRVRWDTSGERLETFADLLVDRADALGVAMRPELGYLAAWRLLLAAGQARLLVAEHDAAMVGGLLLFLQGGIHATAYSADRADLRDELPGTMHLVRWHAICDALAERVPAIELGGVDLPGRREPPSPGDPNHGLYQHKASFGATWVMRTRARRIVLRPWANRVAASRGWLLRRARAARGTVAAG